MQIKVFIVESVLRDTAPTEKMVSDLGYFVLGSTDSFHRAIQQIERHLPDLVLIDLGMASALAFHELITSISTLNIAYIYTAVRDLKSGLLKTWETMPNGFLEKPFSKNQLQMTLECAMSNHLLSHKTIKGKEQKLLAQVSEIGLSKVSLEERLMSFVKILQIEIPFDYLTIEGNSEILESGFASYLKIGFNEYQPIGLRELKIISKIKAERRDSSGDQGSDGITHYKRNDLDELCVDNSFTRLITTTFSLESMVCLTLSVDDGIRFQFSFYNRNPGGFAKHQISILSKLRKSLVDVLGFAARGKVPEESKKINQEHSEAQVQAFGEIIGESPELLDVFRHIRQVAPVNTTVLLLGESGTGKGKIAQALHELSDRKNQPMINVNCTALPSNLIESELFGHEKGAFTGASQRHIGKFERANKGTIFLDEIGEMPMDLQAKLLRVIQEKEIERIGGNTPIPIDVRIIAATNLDLKKEVSAGKFRLDLFFRLNVFPVTLPPLRSRRSDIPLLIRHFLKVHNEKIGKTIQKVSQDVYAYAQIYDWPGNIRELENLVERGVLLCKADELSELNFPESRPHQVAQAADDMNGFKSISESERAHIMTALQHCNGRIWGAGGAAELLKLPPTTLNSKMKKLGIKRYYN